MTDLVAPRRTWRGLLALLLTLAFVATACGSKSNDGGGNAQTNGSDSGTSTDAGKPVPGGKVVYGLEADTAAGYCMPDAQLAIAGIQVARSVFDTLTVPDDSGETYKPYLAKSVTPSADFKSWTIVARDGVTFHDGSPLDGAIIKDNLDAYRSQYFHPDGTKGPPALLFSFVFSNVDTIDLVDPMTVKVNMKTPWVAFPAYLFASGRLGIIAKAQLDDTTSCDKNLIGTGPFKLTSPITNTADIALVKNPTYWQKDADGNQLPYLDALEYRAIPEEAQRINALQSGQIDMMHTDFGQTIAQLRDLKDTVNVTENQKQTEVAYWLINSSKPPFDQLAAREAAALAFDFKTYNQVQNAGVNTATNGPFAPDSTGFVADTGFPTFDLQKAKDKVAEYKAATGQDLTFTLTTTNEPTTVAGAQLYQQMLKDAGITAQLAQTDQSTLINDAVGGSVQMFGWRNHPGGDPDTQYVWWHSTSVINFGHIKDPELDRLLDDGRTNPDPAARKKDYEDVNKIFGKQVYNVWTYYADWTVATAKDIHGIDGPNLPDGSKPWGALVTGHPVLGLFRSK